MTGLSDTFQRPISYLRVSVTDRCNLRCTYCMPPEGIPLMLHEDLLSYEEITKVVEAGARLGIRTVRLTGGEPLARRDLPALVGMLAGVQGVDDLSLTTNGVLLARYADTLARAGLQRVNVSLDSLRRERFQRITRRDLLDDVLAGIQAAKDAGLTPVKVNTVVMRAVNDDEVVDLGRKTIEEGWHVRFIELMPFGAAGDDGESRRGAPHQFVPTAEVRHRLEELGPLVPYRTEAGVGPADYYRYPGAPGTIGFISPISESFCSECNRMRLTADGQLRPCLLADDEYDLREALRKGITVDGLAELIQAATAFKPAHHQLEGGMRPRVRKMVQIGG